MAEIVVAIPTFKRTRPLKRLLQALEKLDTAENVIVVVADNDAAGHEGYDLCRSLCADYRWPLDPVIAEERGIAQVRNVLVARALSYPGVCLVAMIDDDEWPSPQWLSELIKVQRETGADVVEGSILFEGSHDWPGSFDGINSMRRLTGPQAMLEGAGNILITRHCLESLKSPWFDPDFAFTGGEDRDFFERVKAGGGRFAWSDEGLAYTEVPAGRRTLSWLLRRAFAAGNTEMHIFLKYRPGSLARLRELVKMTLALIATPIAGVLLLPSPKRAADAWRRFFRNTGKLTALFGYRFQAYAVPHGG